MVRTQVRLTKQQLDTLRELSTATGRSVAELVRLGVELDLRSQHRPSRKERIDRALRAIGKFSSGRYDVSLHHDSYLAGLDVR
jgi:Arc/MetJ-type ribon-helix-helix transcriptional regulator